MDLFLFGTTALISAYFKRQDTYGSLNQALRDGTTLNADERICLYDSNNIPIPGGGLRLEMRRRLWHRATYVLIKHCPNGESSKNTTDDLVLVQRRSRLKDYCPEKLDPTPGGVVGEDETYSENALRELEEEMGIDASNGPLARLFSFSYEDDNVRVWGDFYEFSFYGSIGDLRIQKTEVDEILSMPMKTLRERVENSPGDFMPDACHAMRLYFQRKVDVRVNRKLLKGYSSSDLEAYELRPKPKVIFFDCDDCLYFDGWKTANMLTAKIDEWCVNHGLKPGQAYDLYKQYGTALRGLRAEGYLDDTEEAVNRFLFDVHDIPIASLIPRDEKLKEILSSIDPSIPKYIFTASVSDHARRCIQALGIEDMFVDIIDCKAVHLETKHSRHSFETAMKIAGVTDPESCLFLDDSLTNIKAAREVGWRSILVGKVGRDHGKEITSEHAELEVSRIHEIQVVCPELFDAPDF